MKFYYRVRIGNDYPKVTSLAEAKKLVQGQKEWVIAKFQIEKNECIAMTDPNWVKDIKRGRFKNRDIFGKVTLAFIDLTKAFMKSRIAK